MGRASNGLEEAAPSELYQARDILSLVYYHSEDREDDGCESGDDGMLPGHFGEFVGMYRSHQLLIKVVSWLRQILVATHSVVNRCGFEVSYVDWQRATEFQVKRPGHEALLVTLTYNIPYCGARPQSIQPRKQTLWKERARHELALTFNTEFDRDNTG